MKETLDENPFDGDHLSAEEKLRNVATIVMKYREGKDINGRGILHAQGRLQSLPADCGPMDREHHLNAAALRRHG